MQGDGTITPNYKRYYTSSKILVYKICELGLKLGYSTAWSKRETKNISYPYQKLKSFYISFRANKKTAIEKKHIKQLNYDGEVWCLNMPNGNFFTERNGIIHLSGNTMNIIGEKQHPEKLLPFLIKNILAGKHIKLHSNKARTNAPTRFFITPNIVAEAIDFLFSKAEKGEKYNIVGEKELSSLDIAKFVANYLGKKLSYELTGDNLRPGHDPRYALDGAKLASMGFKPSSNFWDNLQRIILWYKEHPKWL